MIENLKQQREAMIGRMQRLLETAQKHLSEATTPGQKEKWQMYVEAYQKTIESLEKQNVVA